MVYLTSYGTSSLSWGNDSIARCFCSSLSLGSAKQLLHVSPKIVPETRILYSHAWLLMLAQLSLGTPACAIPVYRDFLKLSCRFWAESDGTHIHLCCSLRRHTASLSLPSVSKLFTKPAFPHPIVSSLTPGSHYCLLFLWVLSILGNTIKNHTVSGKDRQNPCLIGSSTFLEEHFAYTHSYRQFYKMSSALFLWGWKPEQLIPPHIGHYNVFSPIFVGVRARTTTTPPPPPVYGQYCIMYSVLFCGGGN